jgi:glycosidase
MLKKYLRRPNPTLYEINTAAWLFELGQKAGHPLLLREVPASEWDRLKALGMDYVWLLGVWSRSREGRKISLTDSDFNRLFNSVLPGCSDEDIIGSCFAVGANDPDPLIGTWEDLDHAREELHKRDMGLILDFIPNHKGLDHPLLSENPEYFIQVSRAQFERYPASFFPFDYQGRTLYVAHGKDPNFPAWTDTAQLNYFNPTTHQAILNWLKQIAEHCDGVRCDMAMLVLKNIFQKTWGWANSNPYWQPPQEEFWTMVRRELPDLLLIAEAYWDTEWELQQLGFDFVYDKRLYDRLKAGRPADLYLHLKADLEYQSKLLRFIENHDEPRSAVVFAGDKLEAAAVLFSTLPGMKMYFHGQLEGRQIHLPIQIRQTRPEEVDLAVQSFYEKLLSVLNQGAFHAGQWELKEVFSDGKGTAENLIAFLWSLKDQLFLVIANLSPKPASGRVSFEDAVAEESLYSLQGKLGGAKFTRPGKIMAHPGLNFQMAGYQSQIYEIKRED